MSVALCLSCLLCVMFLLGCRAPERTLVVHIRDGVTHVPVDKGLISLTRITKFPYIRQVKHVSMAIELNGTSTFVDVPAGPWKVKVQVPTYPVAEGVIAVYFTSGVLPEDWASLKGLGPLPEPAAPGLQIRLIE